ncbi:hypothetical protein L1887_35677 [Cichorium endivia]|nr:hypothetical protein L1887_35677 [Cichorium endivia]
MGGTMIWKHGVVLSRTEPIGTGVSVHAFIKLMVGARSSGCCCNIHQCCNDVSRHWQNEYSSSLFARKLSHQHEKKTCDILVKQLGEDDSRTRESQNWMKTFKVREAQMAAQKQKGQPADAVSAQAAIDLLKEPLATVIGKRNGG